MSARKRSAGKRPRRLATGLVADSDVYCQGPARPDEYVVAFVTGAASVPSRFGNSGSSMLDDIWAFDKAEVSRTNFGQINLIEVTSFCGPGGVLWGYDLAQPADLRNRPLRALIDGAGRSVPVYDGEPLVRATASLFGTVDRPRFRLAPGTLCPAAYKKICRVGPAELYARFAIGIPDDRSRHAVILMEDAGLFPGPLPGKTDAISLRLSEAAAESVLAVAANQRIRCREIFVLSIEKRVVLGSVGCVLIAAPYFRLARGAMPPEGISRLRKISLAEWLADRGLDQRPHG